MRPHVLFATAMLALATAPAHSAQPGLNLQALHVQALLGDVVFPLVTPLVSSLGRLPALDGLHGLNGVVPGLLSDVAMPLVNSVAGSGLPALPTLEGLDDVVPGVISGALPVVTGVVSSMR